MIKTAAVREVICAEGEGRGNSIMCSSITTASADPACMGAREGLGDQPNKMFSVSH